MNQRVNEFYKRYHMLTIGVQITVPWWFSYLLVLAVVLTPPEHLSQRLGLWLVWGAVCLLGYRTGWLGWVAVGLRRRLIEPDPAQQQRYRRALDAAGDAVGAMQLKLVELGEVPLLQAGGFVNNQLWISTYTLNSLDPDQLACLLAHEYAHMVDRSYEWRLALLQLLWLISVHSYWLLVKYYVLVIVLALLHVVFFAYSFAGVMRRVEWTADQRAVKHCGARDYARALVAFFSLFGDYRQDKGLNARLRALGYQLATAEQLAQGAAEVVKVSGPDA